MADVTEQHVPKPQPLEPRFFARVEIATDVEVEVAGNVLRGRTVNLSEGGLGARLEDGIAKGSSVVVSFPVPGSERTVRAPGQVVRSAAAAGGGYEVGVAFELGEEDAAAVRSIVVEHGGIAWEPAGRALPREVAVRFIPVIRRLARGLVKRLPSDVAVDDLIGAGFVALVELYRENGSLPPEQLDPLATTRLRYAMLDELRENDPLSRRMRKKASELGKARARLQATLGRAPNRAELAAETGLSLAAVDEAERLASSGAARSAVDELQLPDRDASGPEENASRTESIERLRMALEALPPRHKKVLELYYGDDLTLRQIGNLLGVTEARISQLVSESVKKLRHEMPQS